MSGIPVIRRNNWAMIFREIVKEEAWSAAVHGVTKSQTQISNRKTATYREKY